MNKSNFLHTGIGLIIGFTIGFILANNVSFIDPRGADATRAKAQQGAGNTAASSTPPSGNSPGQLSEEELREAIAKADARTQDISLQRNFGLALYRYANQNQESRYLPDVVRFLQRAYDADPKDYDAVVSLGNALFDLGQTSDPERFKEARTYYQKALELRPDDVNVRTDLGLTYYFGRPSDPRRAITEYLKSLAVNPRHEQTLQNLATALAVTGDHEGAEKRINELQAINPSNTALPNLRALLAQSKNKG